MTTQQKKMRIWESAFNDIVTTIAAYPAERGGALFGSEKDWVIRSFVWDREAVTTGSTYTIDATYINTIIKQKWEEDGHSLLGILHSHPLHATKLSRPDREYFSGLLKKISRDQFFTPIVHSAVDGGFKLRAYVMNSDGSEVEEAQIELIPDDADLTPAHEPEPEMNGFMPYKEYQTRQVQRFESTTERILKITVLVTKVFLILWLVWLILTISPSLSKNLIKHVTYGTH